MCGPLVTDAVLRRLPIDYFKLGRPLFAPALPILLGAWTARAALVICPGDLQRARRLAERMRVMQAEQAQVPEQWDVHEMRFYRAGVELPRRAEWRLRVSPKPWDVQFAFDNSPVTRWRSWEVASPG